MLVYERRNKLESQEIAIHSLVSIVMLFIVFKVRRRSLLGLCASSVREARS